MKLEITNKQLCLLLRKYFKGNEVGNQAIADFRSWLQKQSKELNERERQGLLFKKWLLDMSSYYRDVGTLN